MNTNTANLTLTGSWLTLTAIEVVAVAIALISGTALVWAAAVGTVAASYGIKRCVARRWRWQTGRLFISDLKRLTK